VSARIRLVLALALGVTVFPAPAMAHAGAAPSPTPTAVALGPCAQASLASVTNRPGLGRAITINGSPCVVPMGAVVLEASYRDQITKGDGTSRLSTYPNPVVRYGVAGRNEIVLSPSLIYSRRTGAALGGTFIPASGMQDAGFGFKHSLRDRPWTQDALEVFVTLPTGYPAGSFGFSAGAPTYLLGYSASFVLSARVGLTTTHNFSSSAGTNGKGAMQRYLSYQPSLGLSYALSSTTALLLQDQLTIPTAPGGSTGNRALAAIQQTAGPRVVLDVEFEQNLLPTPGFNQNAFGTGFTLRL
jgi:hypothetical protein